MSGGAGGYIDLDEYKRRQHAEGRDDPICADGEKLLDELADLPPLQYGQRRRESAKRLGITVGLLDSEVAKRRPHDDEAIPEDPFGWRIEPWGEPVNAIDLLDEVRDELRRRAILLDYAAEAIALWVLHAWAHDAASISPLLALVSPEKRCGKTTVFNSLRFMTPRPLPTSNVTVAALFRSVEMWQPTLLIDEADTFLENSDELRGVLNSGHARASAAVIRTVGDEHEPKAFKTWAPKAIAKIGRLHDTLADRSIVVPMRRKRPDERVTRHRGGDSVGFVDLRRKAARWTADNLESLKGAEPDLPAGLNDRAADNWRPLIAIADAAGSGWPKLARKAALVLSGNDAAENDSIRTQLLADLRDVFDRHGEDRLSSKTIVERLVAMEDHPWAEWRHGKPMTVRQLAVQLRPFGVVPGTIRLETDQTAKGYHRIALEDSIARYLPVDPSHRHNPQKTAGFCESSSVTAEACDGSQISRKAKDSATCDGVTDQEPLPGADNGIPAAWGDDL